MPELSALQLPVWTFVVVASLSASLGAMVAAQFEAVKVHPNVYLLTTATPALLALWLVDAPVPLIYALWSMALILALSGLAVIDAVTRTVPDMLTLPLIGVGLLHAQANGAPAAVFAIAAFCLIATAVAVPQLLRLRGGWIGGGDVLLLAGAIAWFGPAMLPDILFLTGVILLARFGLSRLIELGPATCVPVARAPDRSVPLAPSLGAAQLLIWMGGPFF